jgi:hypothetical protein
MSTDKPNYYLYAASYASLVATLLLLVALAGMLSRNVGCTLQIENY